MTAPTRVNVHIEGHDMLISNPDKPLWSESNITKMEYLQHLIQLAPYLLPYCENRYLTTIRYPHGIHDKSFYQKNCPTPTPSYIHTARMNEINYINLDSLTTLIWLGNLACLEFHPSFEHIGSSLPAEWIIDIDPSVEEEPRIMKAAAIVGEVLDGLGIQSIPKTSGATGVQIYIPIQSGYTFMQLRVLGEFIGRFLVEKYPRWFTIERLKKNRGTLIYIDYLQHWPGKTLSAPYTPRARENAPVSTPLTWEEVALNPAPQDFTLRTIHDRLQKKGDLIQKVPPQNLDSILSHLLQ